MGEDLEIRAMATAAQALELLDDATRKRVLAWLSQRFGVAKITSGDTPMGSEIAQQGFETFADLFAAADPKTEKEKALVAAFWAQICQNQQSFAALALNSSLKDLGHRVSNITDCLENLRQGKPSLVLQLKKSGTSKQARKTYKLTQEGAKRVRQMIAKEDV